PTIVSRCQTLRFAPLTKAELLSGVEGATEEVTAWSEGSLERAKFLLGQEGGLELRRQACEQMLALWEAAPRVPSTVVRFAESVSEEGSEIVVDSWEILLRDLLFTLAGGKA